MRKLLLVAVLAGIVNAVSIPLSDAISTSVPTVNGDGFFCEVYLGKGGGTPSPTAIEGVTPNADLQSPVLNFPNPGDTVSVSSSFLAFFNNTVYAPESVQSLTPSGFLLRCTTNLKITSALDENPATPEIDISIRSGSDDGHYLVIGNQFLGSSPDHGFTWYSYSLQFEDEGLYPFYLLYSANNAGISGLEVQWDTALSSGWVVLPQEYAYPNTGGGQCEQKVYFDELTEGTSVTTQYQSMGAVFETISGNITATASKPLEFVPVSASNVLADPATEPTEEGIVKISFVDPSISNPATTSYFSTYVIDAEETGATITAYDLEGTILVQETIANKGSASQYFTEIIQTGIYEIIISLGSGTDTIALDNICWATPQEIILPDISVSNLSCPAQGWATMPIDISIDLANTGNSSIAGDWTMNFYLSDDQIYDSETDTLCDSITVSNTLASGASTTLNEQITLADNISGDKWLLAVADETNAITEFPDTDNNIAVSTALISTATDHTYPYLLSQDPEDLVHPGVTEIEIEFSETVFNFTSDDVTLLSPDSQNITIDSIQNTESNIWVITFARQTAVGTYTLTVSSNINDQAGNTLDGNNDGTNDDAYTGTFEITEDPIQTTLFNWVEFGNPANGNWTVSTDGMSVFQSINGNPTFFISDFELTDSRFEGTFKVETTSDDDYIGFVFAVNDTDDNPATLESPFYLVSWKKNGQSSSGYGEEGIKLIRVDVPESYNYWDCESVNGEVLHQFVNTTAGWVSNVLYTFSLSYQPAEGNIRVIITRESDGFEMYNSGLIQDTSPLGTGRVGFYNYSQQSVRYAGFTSALLTPPVAVPGSGYAFSSETDTINLDASASYDPDEPELGFDAISELQWDIGNDGIDDDTGRTNALQPLTLAEAVIKGLAIGNDLTVGLTVYDLDAKSGSATTTVTYTNFAPTADAGGSGDYGTIAYDGTVTLQGTASDPDLANSVGEVLTYEWDTSPATSASEIGDGFSLELSPQVSHSEILSSLGTQSGTIYFNVKDLSGLISSSSATIAVEVPNMAISAPNIYGYAYAGKQSIARYTVGNAGTCPVEGSWVDSVYLSDDNVIGGDSLAGTHNYSFPINVSQSYSGEVTFTVPSDTPEGQKWLVIKTNSSSSIVETSYTDNTLIAGPIEIRHVPVIADMPNETIIAHQSYVSEVPTLEDGTPPIEWSAVAIPTSSVTVDSSTGQVSWPDPLPRLEPYTITIAAQNDGGFDEESWQLTVVTTPEINPISTYTIPTGVSFTSNTPSLSEATAVTWTLVSGPSGMTINSSTGRVTWPSPVKDASPYTVTISATNIAGSDTQSFDIIVMDKPVIAAISDDSVEEWTTYTRNDITLTAGNDTTVTWSLIDRPAGMLIDSITAAISWASAIPSNSSYRVTVKAQNDARYDTETFYLTVNASPVIAGIGDEAISGASPYSKTPVLVRGALPITWALVDPPANMTIDSSTGIISWPSPVVSTDAYTITVTATNTIGSDSEQWDISVQDPPAIEAIEDQNVGEGESFSYAPGLLSGTLPVSWTLVRGPSGLTVDNSTGAVSWAAAVAGDPHEVVIQALNEVGSDTETFYINVPILYSANIQTDTEIATAGTPVTLYGNAYWIADSSPAPDVPVLIRIMLKGMKRTVSVVTDSLGEFSYTWTPFETEAGHYTIAADHPSVTQDIVKDEFDLYGMRLSPVGMRYGLDTDEVKSGTVTIRNLGDQSLTGISCSVNNPSSEQFDIQVTSCTASLNGYGVGELKFTVSGNTATSSPYTPSIDLTCDQGADAQLQFEIMVYEPQPVLEADVDSLEGAMVRGNKKYVEFTLTNSGGSATGPVQVVLPATDFMTLVTPATMPAIEPHETATVTLQLEPAEDAPLNINTGTIAVNAGNAGLTMPYSFECVSDLTGDLLIEATDDYTFQTAEAPKLFGASVTVKDPADGTILYSGVTDASGEILFPDLPEAYYSIEVKADNHGTFTSTILTSGGETTFISAFLPLNLITYNWTVRPTQIEDHYTFTVQAVFETNVPAPVVTVAPALTDLENMDEAEIQINYTLTNNGLITADETDMIFDSGDSNYEFIPLVDEIGSIPAMSSIIVPVLVRDLSQVEPLTPEAISKVEEKKTSPASKEISCSVSIRSYVGYTWECGPDHRRHKVPFYFKFPVVECTGGSTISGGDVYDIYDGGDGWDTGGGGTTWGGSDDGWYIPPVYIPTGTSHNFSTDASCDPCMDKVGKALLSCAISFLPLDCPATLVKSTAECASDCYSGSAWSCAKSCAGGMISVAASCGGDIAKKATPIGWVWNIFWCLWDVGTACLDMSSDALEAAYSCGCYDPDINKMGDIAVSLSEITGEEVLLNDSTIDYLLEEARTQASRIEDIFNMYTVILGSEVWFSGTEDQTEGGYLIDWLQAFSIAMEESSDDGELINPIEESDLLAMPLPSWVDISDAQYAIIRWNNTVSYWQAEITTLEQVPDGMNTNFIPFNEFKDACQVGTVALEEQLTEGNEYLLEGGTNVHDDIQYEVDNPSSGVCARVKIEIVQEAVISRNAFEAVLELSNDGDVDPLENVNVTVKVVDNNGTDQTDLFGIHPPELTGIDSVSGTGTLSASTNCSALWLIVPTQDAAPLEPVEYFVKGSLEYDFAGEHVTIPLYPAKITVMPNPNLVVHYFLEREVYSDDPFTPDLVEPSIPFSLGLMMKNTGQGDAYDVEITSSQPEVIENEKGLLIDFEIIGTIVGTETVSPSLKVNLGDIGPSEVAVAQWLMLCSLQGEFIDYQATFEHIDGLGNPNLSLVESVDIHEMEHVVIADYPSDDQLPDFLVNDVYDQNDLPDTLYNSNGENYVVEAVTDAAIDSQASAADLEVELSVLMPPEGWWYIRIDNPIPDNPQLVLESVTRQDGKSLLVTDNAWVTKKINHKENGDEVEHYLHIFDYGGPGIYTITYTLSDQIKPVVEGYSATDIIEPGDQAVEISVTYSDDVALDVLSIDDDDLVVTSNGFEGHPLFTETDQLGNGTPRTGYYSLGAPPEGWTMDYNGTYTISLAASEVRDSSYNFANATTIGTFEVDIQPLDDPNMTLVSSQRISRTVFEYEYSLSVDNLTQRNFTNQLCTIYGLPETAIIVRDSALFSSIPSQQSTTAPTTIKFRLDLSTSVDWTQIYFEYTDFYPGDIDGNGQTETDDLIIMSGNWLFAGSEADIYPAPYGDGIVDMKDFAFMASNWLN
ncbi:MAG: putative Ig domain-containing protein [Sedimentisphaeraceae bacterium JB056]